jgi:hypothetical protein
MLRLSLLLLCDSIHKVLLMQRAGSSCPQVIADMPTSDVPAEN